MVARKRMCRSLMRASARRGITLHSFHAMEDLQGPNDLGRNQRRAEATGSYRDSRLRQITSVSNRWLAQRLQMGAPTGVSSFLHRIQAGGGTRTRSFRAAVEPFTT